MTFTAIPAASTHFSLWTGACTGHDPTCTATPSTDFIVTASFLAD